MPSAFELSNPGAVHGRLQDVTDDAYRVVADRENRQAFNGLLQAELHLGALVHGAQQIGALLR